MLYFLGVRTDQLELCDPRRESRKSEASCARTAIAVAFSAKWSRLALQRSVEENVSAENDEGKSCK